MKKDKTLDIATGLGVRSKVWRNKKMTWDALVTKLTTENKTQELFSEFLGASKSEQSKIKDVGGYVGGYLRNSRRKPENVVHRQLLTLDIDFAHINFWDDFNLQFDNAAVLHGTHKHSEKKPRFRLIMPLDREATPDEYVAVARYVAGLLGIELFDNTTFETNRLMFWPSNPKDVEYYYRVQEGSWLSVDAALATYTDWTDSSLWPIADRSLNEVKDSSKKQADPEEKKGIVGAFCRTFGIKNSIDTFLDDVYTPTSDADRYTYTSGTTSSGLIVYNDKFAYSHHGTDPCGGHLCNAFDLVRIHKFGHLDAVTNMTSTGTKSYKAMEEFARKNEQVKKTIASENFADAKYDFASSTEDVEVPMQIDVEWATELEVNTRGQYLSTANNLNIIFANDVHLKGLFRQNDFDGKRYIFDSLPWRTVPEPEPMKNVDYSGVRNYIETIYGISGNLKIDDALALEFERYSFHPIRDYLSSLEWDGVPRIDNLLIDYLGAENNIYVKEAMRKMMTAAVARVFNPGCKFDLVVTLVGKQGTGKSTLINKLGRGWFSDTFMTVNGKEALEQLQGAWIIEMAELAGLRKAEVEAVKHFISKQEDMFRPAYARTAETYKRQCVFFGTTNNKDFLRDPSGNRRFIPIDINPIRGTKSVFTDEFDDYIDLFWAEAVVRFKKGEKLYLSKEAEAIAYEEQANHSETDDRKGLVERYLNTKLPENWDTLDVYERRLFLEDKKIQGVVERDYVCIAEIWCECLGKNKEDMTRYNTRDLNDVMRSLDTWDEGSSTKNFSLYGKQRYYEKSLH